MRSHLLLLPILLLGCGTELEEEQPLLGPPRELTFRLNGFSGNGLEYVLDTGRWTMHGRRMIPAAVIGGEETYLRYRLGTAAPLVPARSAALAAALREVTLATLPAAACEAQRAQVAGITFDGDFPYVEVQGEVFGTAPGSCAQLRVAGTFDLTAVLDEAFLSLAPEKEQVRWNGQEYEPI